jgi:hypothetical protein
MPSKPSRIFPRQRSQAASASWLLPLIRGGHSQTLRYDTIQYTGKAGCYEATIDVRRRSGTRFHGLCIASSIHGFRSPLLRLRKLCLIFADPNSVEKAICISGQS